jgi:hypothetical protein
MTPNSSEELHDIPLTISVVNSIYDGRPKAEVSGFFKLGSRAKKSTIATNATNATKDSPYSETIKEMENDLKPKTAKPKAEKKPWD